MKAVSLFSGIGGMDLGLARAGIETVLQAESDPYCLRVLEKHWPNVRRVDDVRKVGGWVRDELGDIDLVYGGPPCQPVSVAGRRQGTKDERWLWDEAWRVVREVQPSYALMESPMGVLSFWDDVLRGMAESGYDGEWDCLPAAAVGAPHRRERVFLVAYPNSTRLERAKPGVFVGAQASLSTFTSNQGWWKAEPPVGRVVDGLPRHVDRLRALGNAVVPQVAELLGQRLMVVAREWL